MILFNITYGNIKKLSESTINGFNNPLPIEQQHWEGAAMQQLK
tara:strand:+ start:36 stop:164 length:129 start_codon:yes stop_codon:yes gene_type:complete